MKKLIIHKSKVHGNGIFANEDIKRGELIDFVKGKIHHLKVLTKRESHSHPNWIGVSKYTWLDPMPPYKFLNHSCNPSAGIKGRISVYAIRNIKKGEEVTIDYATTEIDPLWEMRCLCGETTCRKIIRSLQSLPKQLYAAYVPYIPTYFRKKYLELRQHT